MPVQLVFCSGVQKLKGPCRIWMFGCLLHVENIEEYELNYDKVVISGVVALHTCVLNDSESFQIFPVVHEQGTSSFRRKSGICSTLQ